MRNGILATAMITMVLTCSARAELKDIDQSKLPKGALNAYQSVLSIEPAVKHWSPKWPYKEPSKKAVTSTLKDALAQLKNEQKNSPSNEELVLLVGLVAQYGHNVDIDGAAQLGIDSYQQAQALSPQDLRPLWFLGIHRCEAGLVSEGMQMLLDVEKRAATSPMPATFWDDYLTCSAVSNMPAHVLHAADMIKKSGATFTDRQTQITDSNVQRFVSLTAGKEYDPKEIWASAEISPEVVSLTADLCGLRFAIPKAWGVDFYPIKDSQCAVVMQTGPYKTPRGEMYPNVLLIARPAKAGESLEQFSKTIQSDNPGKPTAVPACPVSTCLAYEAVKPNGYKESGDAHAIFVAFESREPQTPGLKFEQPQGPPQSADKKIHYYRPITRYRRASGTFYYQVLLDTATSMDEQATKDLLTVLKSVEVE